MKISNLKKISLTTESSEKKVQLSCDVECKFCSSKTLWFEVDESRSSWLTDDVYDAFLVAALYPAMYYKEDIEICGNVTKRIFYNIVSNVTAIIKMYDSSFRVPEIKVGGFASASKNETLHVGTGFSGGVDSFSTIYDHYVITDDPDYKIDTLFFFHIGQYGDVKLPETWERAKNRYSITENFAKEVNMHTCFMTTNLFDFYLPKWEFDAGVLCRIASVLVFQKALKLYYICNDYSYGEMIDLGDVYRSGHMDLADMSNPYIMPLLSPERLEIVCDGMQYTRGDKIEKIADYPLVARFLNVCIGKSTTKAINCGICYKCLHTMLTFDIIGKLDNLKGVFDLSHYAKVCNEIKCQQVLLYGKEPYATSNIELAKKYNYPMPTRTQAWLTLLPKRIIRKFQRNLGITK